MKFLLVLAQLYVNKHEAKCNLLIAWQLLLFSTLTVYINWKYFVFRLKI